MHRIFIQVHRVNVCFTLILMTVMKVIFLNLMRRAYAVLVCTALGLTSLWAQNAVSLQNTGFEFWQDDLPLSWFGSSSNIPKASVSKSTEAYSGNYSCCLLRTQKTHIRFGSEAVSLTAGNYQLSYFVKGNGCIRNSIYNGTSYAAYSDYDTLVGSAWKQIEYAFVLKKEAEVQLLFSLCQTDTIGLFIDDVSLRPILSDVGTNVVEKPCVAVVSGVLHLKMTCEDLVCIFNPWGQMLYRSVLSAGVHLLPFPSGCYIVKVDKADCCQKVLIP